MFKHLVQGSMIVANAYYVPHEEVWVVNSPMRSACRTTFVIMFRVVHTDQDPRVFYVTDKGLVRIFEHGPNCIMTVFEP